MFSNAVVVSRLFREGKIAPLELEATRTLRNGIVVLSPTSFKWRCEYVAVAKCPKSQELS